MIPKCDSTYSLIMKENGSITLLETHSMSICSVLFAIKKWYNLETVTSDCWNNETRLESLLRHTRDLEPSTKPRPTSCWQNIVHSLQFKFQKAVSKRSPRLSPKLIGNQQKTTQLQLDEQKSHWKTNTKTELTTSPQTAQTLQISNSSPARNVSTSLISAPIKA